MAELITQRIQRNANELRLHAIAENPDELIERAEQAELGYREFLDLLLESEVGVLEGRHYQARLKMAGLPPQDPRRLRHQLPTRPGRQAPRRAALTAVHRAQGRRPDPGPARRW